MRARFAWRVVPVLVVTLVAFPCYGSVVSYQSSLVFSGTAPAGPSPWITTTFDDFGSTGTVKMTVSATNLVGVEFVRYAYANLDPSLNPTQLVFSAPTQTGYFANPTVSLGVNAYQADGDGYFDIRISFANSDGASTRFTDGDSVSYLITGISNLTAQSFAFDSQAGGGEGVYPVAQHVQGIGYCGDYSGWVSVPEPATLSLLALGGAVMAIRRRRV